MDVVSADSVTVSWLPPDVDHWNGIITSYTVAFELIRRVDKNEDSVSIRTDTLTYPQPGEEFVNDPDPRVSSYSELQIESVIVAKIEEFYVYRFSVFLENSVGASEVSSAIEVTMPPAGNSVQTENVVEFILYVTAPSGPPRTVNALALSSTSILITWDNPGEFEANGIITSFEIRLRDISSRVQTYTQPGSTFSLHLESKFASSCARQFKMFVCYRSEQVHCVFC